MAGRGVDADAGGACAIETDEIVSDSAAIAPHVTRMPRLLVRIVPPLGARRHPRIVGPAGTVARHFDVDEIGLAVGHLPSRETERRLQVGRCFHPLAVHAETAGDRGHVHVGLPEVVVHEPGRGYWPADAPE